MSKCGKCDVPFAEGEETLTCVDCKMVFHAQCTRNKTLRGTRKPTWKCDGCFMESSSNTSRTSEKDSGTDKISAVLASLDKLQKDMSVQFKGVNDNIGSVKEDFQALSIRIDGMKEAMDTLSAENIARKEECAKLAGENAELKDEVAELKGHIFDMQQYSRRDNVEIFGVPMTAQEDVYYIIQQLAAVISVPYNRNDISIAHRMPLTKRSNHPSIIVKFISRTTKTVWMRAAKQCKVLTAAELRDTWEPIRIFIRDHLTIDNKMVLARAKELVRMKKLAFAWCRDSRILVRKTADAPAKCIKSVSDIEDVLKE